MTFSYTESTSSENAADVTTHTIALPNGCATGKKLITFVGIDGTPTTTTKPTAWADIIATANDGGNNIFLSVWERQIDGSEGFTGTGDTVTFATVTAQRSRHHTFLIASGHDTTTASEGASAGSAGTSTTPDPPSLTPGGGSKAYLWLALCTKDTSDSPVSAWPSGYTNTGESSGGSFAASDVAIGWATKEATASSDDPSAFTIGESEQWVAATVAVYPGTAAPVSALQSRKVYVLP